MTERKPTLRKCFERDCDEPAGGRWSPYWCPTHDAERVERISRSLDEMTADIKEATE